MSKLAHIRPIPVLLVTYNRLNYSQQALESICENPGHPIELMIWDNASTDGTVEWLREYVALRIFPNTVAVSIEYSGKNVGLAPAMNAFFRKYSTVPYVVKVDNDTVMPDNWLADLMEVMECAIPVTLPGGKKLGAVSGTCLRPYGLTADEWYAGMPWTSFKSGDYVHKLYFNSYCLGTGVLINMDMIRERGLLFEKFPRAPGAAPDDPCLISGWGAYIREAHEYEYWKFALYSKVPVNLLNLKADHVLSNDYPEYDAEVTKVRDEGNAWWESVGGLPGVRKYVQDHGGLEPASKSIYWHGLPPVMQINGTFPHGFPLHAHISETTTWPEGLPSKVWTDAGELQQRSTLQFWNERVKKHGTTASTFLTTPQIRINEFTERHTEILHDYARNRDVCEVGIGWGRMSLPIAKLSKSYVGVDFIPELVAKAKESMPDLDLRVASATKLPFAYESFDLIVAIACLSSFAAILPDVIAEMKRVLRPWGRILFLEEDFARVDWKMENH